MDAELLEFVISEDSRILGKKIKDLEISRTATIGGIIRAGEGIIALGDFEIIPGDRVLVCCLPKSISILSDCSCNEVYNFSTIFHMLGIAFV